MAVTRILPAGFAMTGTDGGYVLLFADHVMQQTAAGPRLVPTGLTIEVGPIEPDDARQMCAKIVEQLDADQRTVEVPKPTVLRAR